MNATTIDMSRHDKYEGQDPTKIGKASTSAALLGLVEVEDEVESIL